MSLTQDDLQSIKTVIKQTVHPMLKGLDNSLSMRVANGLVDVETRLRKDILGAETRLTSKIDNLNIRQGETLGLVLQQDERIKNLKPVAGAK